MEASALQMPRRLLRPATRRLTGDEALVAAVRAGDEGGFETIFDRYHRALLSFCRHMLGNREEAEDAVQQTFMAAYRDLSSSSKPILLRPWLYTIARNNCLSILRARRENVPLDDVAPSTEGLASEVQRREDLRQMLVDLRQLPDDQRAALVLAELGSLPHQEIADVVGCPRDKVKALIFQARSSLAASRTARETPCGEVREQLATLSGGALRRSGLRRHVRQCAGCRDFEADVRRQRRAMAVLLPVVPTAGLRDCVLGAVGLNAGGGAGLAGGGAVGSLGAGGLAKVITVGVVTLGAGVGGVTALSDRAIGDSAKGPAAAQAERGAGTDKAGRFSHPDESGHAAVVSAAQRRAASRAIGASAPTGNGTRGKGQPTASAASGSRGGDARAGGGSGRSGDRGGSGERGGGGDRSSGEGNRGQAQAPGQAGTAPGLSGSTPGQSGRTPAQGSPAPGTAGTSPGRAESTPGQSGSNPGGGRGGGGGGDGKGGGGGGGGK